MGIDLDGCCADFNTGFAPILTKHSGIVFPGGHPDFPASWEWWQDYGVTPQQNNVAWREVDANPMFWASLPPMPGATHALRHIDNLSFQHDFYFITKRRGPSAKRQSEEWLHKFGVTNPTVLLSKSSKGWLALGLELDVMIDDKPQNLWDVRTVRGNKCRYYLVDAPHSRKAEERSFSVVVGSVREMLEKEGLIPIEHKEDEWR